MKPVFKRLASFAVLFGFTLMGLTGAVVSAGDAPLARMILLPAQYGEEVDKADVKFFKPLRKELKDQGKVQKIDVLSLDDMEEQIKACADFVCVSRIVNDQKFDLAVLPKVKPAGDKMEVEFTIQNLNEQKVKRTKKYTYPKGKFDPKTAALWATELLAKPQELLSQPSAAAGALAAPAPVAKAEPKKPEPPKAPEVKKAEPAPAPAPVAVAPVPAEEPKPKKAPKVYTADDVKKGMKDALTAYLAGDLKGAKKTAAKFGKKPRCKCSEDEKANRLYMLIESFELTYEKVQASTAKNDPRLADDLKDLEEKDKTLTEEARKMGLTQESKFAGEIRAGYAKAYVLKGRDLVKNGKFAEARKAFETALEKDKGNKEAQDELAKFPQYAQKLYNEAINLIDTEPEEAKAKLEIVKSLVEKGSDLYKKAQKKITEIEEEEEEEE